MFKEIHKQLLTFAHHQDYESSKTTISDLEKKIKQKKVLYDHGSDKKVNNKWLSNKTLKKIDLNDFPKYFSEKIVKYKDWLE